MVKHEHYRSRALQLFSAQDQQCAAANEQQPGEEGDSHREEAASGEGCEAGNPHHQHGAKASENGKGSYESS